MANTIQIVRGDSYHFKIEITDEKGDEYKLQDSDDLVFTVKTNTRTKQALLTKHGAEITISPEDTEDWDYGTYKYDVQLTTADGEVCTVVKPTSFIVGDEVTW